MIKYLLFIKSSLIKPWIIRAKVFIRKVITYCFGKHLLRGKDLVEKSSFNPQAIEYLTRSYNSFFEKAITYNLQLQAIMGNITYVKLDKYLHEYGNLERSIKTPDDSFIWEEYPFPDTKEDDINEFLRINRIVSHKALTFFKLQDVREYYLLMAEEETKSIIRKINADEVSKDISAE